jgi:hypothetical protein
VDLLLKHIEMVKKTNDQVQKVQESVLHSQADSLIEIPSVQLQFQGELKSPPRKLKVEYVDESNSTDKKLQIGSKRISPIKQDRNINYESDSNVRDFYEESGHECSPDRKSPESCAICGSPVERSISEESLPTSQGAQSKNESEGLPRDENNKSRSKSQNTIVKTSPTMSMSTSPIASNRAATGRNSETPEFNIRESAEP